MKPLEERSLVIVTGKGGTGKTSVSAALALGAAARGKRVLVAAVDPDARLARLFGAPDSALGTLPAPVHPGVEVCHIDPFDALGEYVGLQIGTRRVVDPVLRQKTFRQLLEAAPGWRDLITLGKVWHFSQMQQAGRPRFDLIVVDAPATGHGLTFLDVPRVVVSAVRTGPLRKNAAMVEQMIEDPERTLLLPVALAEELPARETIELVERVRKELSIALDRVVVNAVHAPALSDELATRIGGAAALETRLRALPGDLSLGALARPAVLADCLGILRARAELNERFLATIGSETQLPTTSLPYLGEGLGSPEALMALARALLPPREAGS